MILAIANNKGGVGKTTTAINLGAALAANDARVLIVDMDAQASAAYCFGLKREELTPSTADILLGHTSIKRAIRHTSTPGLDLVPGSINLVDAEAAIMSEAGRENKLARELRTVRKDYDVIIIDCPPALGILTVNAIVAADAILIPVSSDYLAVQGLVNFLNAIEEIRAGIGVKAPILGMVITRIDYRTATASTLGELLREQYRKQVFKTEVRINIRLAEAPAYGQTIFEYDASSTGAQAYNDLAAEVVRRMKALA